MPRYSQPSLWSKPIRTEILSVFTVGRKKVVQRKVKSGGTHRNSRRFTLSGSLFDRKKSGRLR